MEENNKIINIYAFFPTLPNTSTIYCSYNATINAIADNTIPVVDTLQVCLLKNVPSFWNDSYTVFFHNTGHKAIKLTPDCILPSGRKITSSTNLLNLFFAGEI